MSSYVAQVAPVRASPYVCFVQERPRLREAIKPDLPSDESGLALNLLKAHHADKVEKFEVEVKSCEYDLWDLDTWLGILVKHAITQCSNDRVRSCQGEQLVQLRSFT